MAERQRTRGPVRTTVVWSVLQAALDGRAAEGRALEVLDAGGGTGRFAVPLAELGHHVTVVDPSPDALAALERRAAEAGVSGRVRGVQGDAAGLPEVAGPASVDVVLCHGVLEHVEDPTQALAHAAAALRPDGLLSLLAAQRSAAVVARALAGHFAAARRALDDPAGRWGEDDPVPRRFTEDDLLGLVRAAGLLDREVHGVSIVADLVPGGVVDLEPGGAEALLDLELAAAERPALRPLATQLHVLADRG